MDQEGSRSAQIVIVGDGTVMKAGGVLRPPDVLHNCIWRPMPEPDTTSASPLHVADSKHLTADAFSYYHEMLKRSPIPFSVARPPDADTPFAFRIESVGVRTGAIGAGQCTQHAAEITGDDIGKASMDCFIFGIPLSSAMLIEQGEHQNISRPGDLFIYDTTRRTRIFNHAQKSSVQHLIIAAPRDAVQLPDGARDHIGNLRIPRDRVTPALTQCFDILRQNLRSATADELAALYDACLSLLPLALGGPERARAEIDMPPSNEVHREILAYVNEHIADIRLSPALVASALGISDRYLHKIFLRSGTTFSAYVRRRRLDCVRVDLLTLDGRPYPIAAVASRWGFADISTFYKAFRERFDCTPREYRLRHR